MALGAVTLLEHMETMGDRRVVLVTIQATSGANYTVGGELLAAGVLAATGIGNVELVLVQNLDRAGAKLVSWDHVAGKLKTFSAVGTEALVNTDHSAVVVPAMIVGF